MGNAPPSSRRPAATAAGSVVGSSFGENPSMSLPTSNSDALSYAPNETARRLIDGNKQSVSGVSSVEGVSIQTLGSGGTGPSTNEEASGYYYNVDNLSGAPFGGFGAGAPVGDPLLSSLLKDLSPSALGGGGTTTTGVDAVTKVVNVGRLWPGSGRMMRSYRVRVRSSRIRDNIAKNRVGGNNAVDSSSSSSSLPLTIELACKSFVVRSERGEAPLREILAESDAELKRLRALLADPVIHPHILVYARWIVGASTTGAVTGVAPPPVSRTIYLLRQHAHASLSDRLLSRPFLTSIEKNWIVYQLLIAIQSLHDADVCHGHLTTENVLLTSWNWVLIGDVGCQHYKPMALPDDDPGPWIHWFEGRGFGSSTSSTMTATTTAAAVEDVNSVGSGHRGGGNNSQKKCCLAPERFYSPGGESFAPIALTPEMDVFSMGCVLIELFLNGERAMDLGDLMEYRRCGASVGNNIPLPQSLKQKLDKIESSKMRAACRHMLTLDPVSRLTPVEYLERISSNDKSMSAPIPSSFGSALYPFMLRLRTQILSPDARIALVAMNYGELLNTTVGVDDAWGKEYFSRVIGPTLLRYKNSSSVTPNQAKAQPTKPAEEKKETDLSDLSMEELLIETEDLLRQLDSGFYTNADNSSTQTETIKPVAMFDHFPKLSCRIDGSSQPSQSAIIIPLQIVFSSVGHVQRASSKFVALKLMHRIALFSSDDIRLQRIIPFVISLLNDSEPIVRASGISVLASVLSAVTTFPPSDASIFPRYVFKKVAHLITDNSLVVRVAFAQNIALLAQTARRFLDVGHSVRLYETVAGRQSLDAPSSNDKLAVVSETSGTTNSLDATTTMITSTYDSDLAALHEVVFRWAVHITTDTSDHSSQSKQALLRGLPRLCNFFGVEYSFQILPIILAFLNDRKDWQLRATLCRHLPSVCVSVGRAATEQFVVPCIETSLNDNVEQVIYEAVSCLNALTSLSLLTRTSLLGTEIASADQSRSPVRSRRKKQGVIEKCGPLLLHPSHIVRTGVASLICMCSRLLGVADSEIIVNQLLKPYLKFKPTFESTPHLLACAKDPTTTGNSAANLTSSNDIQAELETSAKLANSLSVPSQNSVELVAKSDFIWYEPLHLAASKNQCLSAAIHTLGHSSLQKVYDLNIEIPNEASNRILINKMDENQLARSVGNKDDLTDEIITGFLSRPVVRLAESACRGEYGAAAIIDQLVPENSHAYCKIQALDVPPLSPSLGLARNECFNTQNIWRPQEDKFLGSTGTEHVGPVNRLAVSEDQSFFVSASFDGTSKVFELRQTHDSGGDIHSCLTYDGHKAGNDHSRIRINDCCILEHTHSVATAASDGSLHVWRVDTVTSNQSQFMKRPRVSGHSALRNINFGEGEVLAVNHFNTPSASILAFATQRGNIHSLDLRIAREPFSLNLKPELGYLTDMDVGNDRNWVVAGTSRGYVGLWDIRYQTMVKLWRHCRGSPISRLIDAFGTSPNEASRPMVFMGCDNNEASLFDLSTGGCIQCYRVLDSSLSYVDQVALPSDCLSIPNLESVNIPSRLGKRIVSLDKAIQMTTTKSQGSVRINALTGCINPQGHSYLITGGSDRMIRLWDLKSGSKSCCVSGLDRNQSSPSFEQVGGKSRLLLCRQPPPIDPSMMESSKLPVYNRQGVVKPDSRHIDSILDLKEVQNPALLLSASRDNTIKLWG